MGLFPDNRHLTPDTITQKGLLTTDYRLNCVHIRHHRYTPE